MPASVAPAAVSPNAATSARQSASASVPHLTCIPEMSSAEGTGESRTGVPGTAVRAGVEGADAVVVCALGGGGGATAQLAISTAPRIPTRAPPIDLTLASIHRDEVPPMQVCTEMTRRH